MYLAIIGKSLSKFESKMNAFVSRKNDFVTVTSRQASVLHYFQCTIRVFFFWGLLGLSYRGRYNSG
jgi:hypothetical protein